MANHDTQLAPAPHGESEQEDVSRGAMFPIVGVGASAGGLEAFTQLLQTLPLDTGMGFVLVQHLDPDHESALTHILSRATQLPVREISNDEAVKPNHVYVIPPDTNLSIANGVMKLQPRPRTRTPHRPIDGFFESLAQDQREGAIGVVLSGTATDGTLGLEAIKAEGGITFAQDGSAKYDSMPRSASAAGCVDLVLAPADIARELARIAKHPYVAGMPFELSMRGEKDRAQATAHEDDGTALPSGGRVDDASPLPADRKARGAKTRAGKSAKPAETNDQEGYKKILLLLRNHSGVDFSLYRSNTIQRRVTRRLVLNKQNTLRGYADFARGNGKELDALYSDVLISVTSFFRNPEMFEILGRDIFPGLLKQRTGDPIRVWVLGCSTGQEAYSIAMTYAEAADNAARLRKLQVFATDLNDTLLDKARQGLYAKTLADDISPERLRRFFVAEDGGYRILKSLREMVVFARQNLISDPPFSRMDVISCRNLLIYLDPSLQKRALPTFHYALRPNGFLLLGASESIGGFTDLFEPVDKKHKVYARRSAPASALHLPIKQTVDQKPAPRGRWPAPAGNASDAVPPLPLELIAQREADRIAMHRFAPPGVLINADLQVLQFRGPTGAYLEPPAGKASFDVVKMAREGLTLPLRNAIRRARKDNQPVRKDGVRFEHDGAERTVNLEVIPLKNVREQCFLILFEDAAKAGRDAAPAVKPGNAPPAARRAAREDQRRSAGLEAELSETRDYLQAMQEQHEAVNEELQAANEEVQSANEELQSINEELETSKEELESANEELTTINEEMAHRNAELNRLNNDMVNVQTSAKLAIVLLGRDLKIRRFSQQAERQFDLMANDIGRPISHVRHRLIAADSADPARAAPIELEEMASEVIAEVREQEREVIDHRNCWHSLRLRPYMTIDNKVDGAVLTLVDIDALKRTEQDVAAARDYAESVLETVREPLLVLDAQLRVESANRSFYRTFGINPKNAVGQHLYDLGNREWDIPPLRELLSEIIPQHTSVEAFEVERDFAQLGRRTMLLNAQRIDDRHRKTERILLAIEDITERRQAEQAKALLGQIVASSGDAIISKDLDGIITSWNEAAQRVFGYAAEEVIGKPVALLIPADHAEEESEILQRLRRGESIEHLETVRQHKDGRLLDISLTISPVRDAGGRIIGAAKIAHDITEGKESERRWSFVMDSMPQKVVTIHANGDVDYFNPLWVEYTGQPYEQIKDNGWRGFIHPDDLEQTLQRWQRSLASGETFLLEHRFRRADGEYRWHLTRIQAMRESGGEIAMWVGSSTDIHEQLETANTLREYSAELFEADRRKNEFLAMLAHELRNPLAPIRNALQIMRLAGSDAAGSASTMMERQVGQMVRLVDDLLDVSRISRGRIELRKGAVELNSVVHQAVEAARPLADSMGHELTVTLPPEPLYLEADPTRLAQVVGNLLNNASKYTGHRGRIWLAVEREDDVVVIRVRDTGIGIAAEQLPRVFEMFMQADTSLERSTSGLGIGLTLVKNLVEMHGGSVEAHSAGVGQGSEFIVRLPLLAEPPPAVADGIGGASITTHCRILVVDDNRDAAESLVMLLTLTGNEMRAAYDGVEAIEAAASFKPQMVLLDIGLPKLNGYEVARKLRALPGGKDMMLVALTGWGQDEDRRKTAEAGFDAHLVKPVDHGALQDLLSKLVSCSPQL